jgi:hypothetical protein
MWTEPTAVGFAGGSPAPREAAWIRFLRQIGLLHYLGFGFFAPEDKVTGALNNAGTRRTRTTDSPPRNLPPDPLRV